MNFQGIDLHEPSSTLKLLIKGTTEEDRLKAKAAGCYYSNHITETKTEGMLITRTRAKTFWACFTGPYIALHDTAPDPAAPDVLPTATDYIVLSPETTFEGQRSSSSTSNNGFVLRNVFQNRTVSMSPDFTRSFGCGSEREVEEWRCAIQSVVEVLRGDFSLPTLPSVPSQPCVESIKHDAVRLSWRPTQVEAEGKAEAEAEAEESDLPTLHYCVATRRDRGEWSEPILVHSSTPFVIVRDLDIGTQYTWRVCAVNVLGVSEWSNISTKVSTLKIPTESPGVPSIVGRGTRVVVGS